MGANDLNDCHRALAEIHSAPKWLWPALVAALIEHDWTVEAARKAAQSSGGSALRPPARYLSKIAANS